MNTTTEHKPTIFEITEAVGVYRMPVLSTLNFTSKAIRAFDIQQKPAPLFLELNLAAPCQMACQYCFTESAKPLNDRTFNIREVDKHALLTKQTQHLSVSEISEAMLQFADLGGRVIFLCSEGEVILKRDSCEKLAQEAKNLNLGLIFYTNMRALTEDYAIVLKELNVNLSLKLESLSPEVNNKLIPGKTKQYEYKYTKYKNLCIPEQLNTLLNVYRQDLSMLGLSSTVTALNVKDIIDVRKFAYDYGMQHMIKGLHFDGYAENNVTQLRVSSKNIKEFEDQITKLDVSHGYSCPRQNYGEDNQHSYDIRTWLNFKRSFATRMPAKVITNQAGAFCEWKGFFVSIRDQAGVVDLSRMFRKLSELSEADDGYANH